MTDTGPTEGEEWFGKEVLEIKSLSEEGWKIYRVDGNKSEADFIVKVINPDHPRGIKIKHAHFAIDFFGKLRQDQRAALTLFDGLIEIWQGKNAETVLDDISDKTSHLSGYSPEFFLYTMDWILEQEDINYTSGDRGPKKQSEIDQMLSEMEVSAPSGREGSHLAISLFSDIAAGEHPVEAFYRVGIDVVAIR
jgi:hypothetical protein